MMQKVTAISRWLGRLLESRYFWWFFLGIFSVQTVWFVLSAQYPMAFDENYHFGLIQLHAQQWLPFFTSQPEGAGMYGALVRDPSYLFHWLMSFPYRLIAQYTSDQVIQIIVLRFISAALFIWSLLVYRRVLREASVSAKVNNVSLALFVLIPIVPFLAATINYDNLFFVCLAYTALLSFKVVQQFAAGQIRFATVMLLVSLMALSCIVKYSFLPVAAVTAVFIVWKAWRYKLLNIRGIQAFGASIKLLTMLQRALLVVVLIVSLGLFAERYVPNLISYHNPVPACNDVISEDDCLQYGPFGRDQLYISQKPTTFHANVFGYLWQWLDGLWYRLYFAINFDYATAAPLYILSRLGAGLAIVLGIGLIVRFRALFQGHTNRQYLLLITVGYAVVLFQNGFEAYAKTGQPVAINGRYILPFLPFLLAFGCMAWSQILSAYHRAKPLLATLLVAIFLLQGGGAVTFLIRSHDEWFWQNNIVRSVNKAARSALWYTIPYKDNLKHVY